MSTPQGEGVRRGTALEATTDTPGWREVLRAADAVIDLPAGGGPLPLRRIEPGTFTMGSRGWGRAAPWFFNEEPAHAVRISQPFYLGCFPVTQAQFRAWTETVGEEHQNHFSSAGDLAPAERVTWDQARRFSHWVGELESAPPGHLGDLPTEAEWEFACRAGTTTDYSSGDGDAALRVAGWFDESSESSTQAVGRLEANPWGLFDLHGNVDEWCFDGWDERAYRKRAGVTSDPLVVPDSSPYRVVRGGSWDFPARLCRSASRYWIRPDNRIWFQGFRVCLLPGPAARASGRGAPPTEPGGDVGR